MADGGPFFIIWQADPNSFKVLDSSYYGKDELNVFCRGELLKYADSKTFTVMPQRDKGVYFWTARDKYRMYEGCD